MRLVIFSHFDYENIIDEYVIYYLAKLKKLGSDIIFVSTSNIDEIQKNKIKNICMKIITRDNIGYDFMSYKTGFQQLEINESIYDQIVFCNDSVYGPIYPLENMFSEMKKKKETDCWGVLINNQFEKHIQSFFIVFEKNTIVNGFLRSFIENIEVLDSKEDVIKNYEIGLSKQLKKNNYNISSFVKFPNILFRLKHFFYIIKIMKIERNTTKSFFTSYAKFYYRFFRKLLYWLNLTIFIKSINNSIFWWRYSIIKKNPLLKIELLRTSPVSFDSVDVIINELTNYTDYPIDLIISHLKRTSKYYRKSSYIF